MGHRVLEVTLKHARMFYQSESGEHHYTKSKSPHCLTCVTLEMELFGSCFIFLTLPLRLSRGECHGNIYTPETEQMHLFLWLLFTSPAQRLLVLEVLEMKGKRDGSVLVGPVYFRSPPARGPPRFSVVPQNTWRQVLVLHPRRFWHLHSESALGNLERKGKT